ncbi:AMP-binding protein, partial [Streptomyces sp. SID89]|nr:AMP-binding protein [Streptomyces sp. SID89]
LIVQAAAAQPDAVAVRVPGADGTDASLTYAELERRSRDRARRLRRLGVREGAVVAVCLDKSAELIVTLLAILRAGAAYLPLAPEDPDDRLEHMTAQAGSAHLVT